MNFEEQETIDKNQMIAGLELGRALIDFHKNNPNKHIKKEDIMDQLAELGVPERYKDLSRDDLRKMVFDSYIRKTSIAMTGNYLEDGFVVNIPPKHISYVNQLTTHWEEKGFVVSTVTDEHERITRIVLEW